MSNVRSTGNAFQLNDFTDEMLLIDNEWGLINSLGLFSEEGVSKNTVEFDETVGTIVLLEDKPRGERANYNRDDYSQLRAIPIPHFNQDDAIKPEDVQGRRRNGTASEDETVANVRAKKMLRLRKSWSATLEFARAKAIEGTVYNPNGTSAISNWYTEFGITQKSVDFLLGTATTDLIAKIEEAIAHSQDNILSGEVVSEFVAICSPTFFSALVSHPSIEEAYKYYTSTQEPLRRRLGSGRFRQFEFGGMTFIEYRGTYKNKAGSAQNIITAGDAYVVPMGTSDTFKTYYGPAAKFQFVNTIGESQYMFEYDNGTDTEITIETESNFLNVVRRPASVVRMHSSN